MESGPRLTGADHDPSEEGFIERETAVLANEQLVRRREEAASLREEAASIREQSLRLREETAQRRIATSTAEMDIQLLEVNERLVVASVKAQNMADAAEQATERMSYIAAHDFLTGLPNRSVLNDRLVQSIALAQRHGKKVALMFLDLDHFKNINDSLGHAVGDQLLQSVAQRLQACIRGSDTVIRQGGDEFVVLLTEVEQAQDAALTAEKLIETMAEPHLIDGHRLQANLSVGISLYPDDCKDAAAMVRNADTAMYHAKKNGRNNYQRFTQDMNARAVKRQSDEEALRHALEQNKFVLHYQPKVNLETGAITGVEALLRWQRTDSRLIFPVEFVRTAEDCGLILPIGKWVLREACRQTAKWLQNGFDIGQIAVNVSAVEFNASDFFEGVRTILHDTGLNPKRLELELTESVLMRDTERATAVLHDLKELGVQIAIDDFGTGYSSLSYLRRLPINTLKIDQSFVQDIHCDAGEAIISAIIAMGASLKLRVVAEGIETSQQLACLDALRCPEGQGFLFSRPVTADEFARVAANGVLTAH